MKNATVTTARQLRDTLAESYRRTDGLELVAHLPGATVRVPAFLSVDIEDINGDTTPHRINVGALILEAVAYHVSEWGQSERGAMSELSTLWVDMVTHPNAPAVELVAIDWALELHGLVSPGVVLA